mmetsp:Transcript_97/g.166  ORF Transcript_97/g.166 Transcript_97/m.166 type:complete len:514 (+) Transcript_97:200-1741(+)
MTTEETNLANLETVSQTSSQPEDHLLEEEEDNRMYSSRADIEDSHMTSINPTERVMMKAELMEDDLRTYHKLYAQLRDDRDRIDNSIHDKDENLMDITKELEEQTKLLHEYQNQLRRKQQEVIDLSEQIKIFEELSPMYAVQAARGESMKDIERRTAYEEEDTDTLERIQKMQDAYQLKKKQLKQLNNEVNTMYTEVDTKDDTIEELMSKLKISKTKEDTAYLLESENHELNYQIDNLNKEIKTLQQITKMKSNTIDKLNEKIQKWHVVRETHRDMMRKRYALYHQLKKMVFELKDAQEAFAEQRQELDIQKNNQDLVPQNALKSDSSYLSNQLAKQESNMKEMENTIATKSKQAKLVRKRLSVLNQALKDTKLSKVLRGSSGGGGRTARGQKAPLAEQAVDVIAVNHYHLMQMTKDMFDERIDDLNNLAMEKKDLKSLLQDKIASAKDDEREDTASFKQVVAELEKEQLERREEMEDKLDMYKQQESALKQKIWKMRRKLAQANKRRPVATH